MHFPGAMSHWRTVASMSPPNPFLLVLIQEFLTMRFISVLAAGLLISSTAIAQSQTFAIHPGSTSYTSRGNLGTGSGETLMGLHSAYWQGLGDDGSACSRTQLGLVDQDQNSNTQESFHLVIRSGTDSNGPGTGSSDVLYRYGPFNMPSTPTGSINAWIQTVTLGTPAVVRCGDFHSWGAEMTPSTNWSRDGMSTHTAFSRTNRNMQFCHLNSEPHGYYFTAGSSRATADTGNARTWRYRMGLSAARNVLQMGSTGNVLGGGTNQRYGMGGMFPNNTETLSARTTQCPAGADVLPEPSWRYPRSVRPTPRILPPGVLSRGSVRCSFRGVGTQACPGRCQGMPAFPCPGKNIERNRD